MMQDFCPSDVLRCIFLNLPKGPNFACRKEDLTSARPARNSTMWKETLAQRRNRATAAQWDGLRLKGLASARVRSGHRAWEIDRFFLANGPSQFSANGQGQQGDVTKVALELLDRVVQEAGNLRAERLFLRLSSNNPIFLMARQAGFFPNFEETLLEGWGSPPQGVVEFALPDWQPLSPHDEYSLFQLYCAATPQTVRIVAGLTFDQWRNAQEAKWRQRSWVAKSNDRVVGWLGLSQHGRVTGAELLAHPNSPDLWDGLVEQALAQGGLHRWLVPDYQDVVTNLLLRRNFRAVASYSMMTKTVAVPVLTPGMAAVEA